MAARPETGLATIWAACWMAVCLSVAGVAMTLAAAVAAQHHVDGAADLVSLSAAARLQHGADACAVAARAARANGVALQHCSVDGQDVVVVVSVRLRLPFGIDRQAQAAARAGPT